MLRLDKTDKTGMKRHCKLISLLHVRLVLAASCISFTFLWGVGGRHLFRLVRHAVAVATSTAAMQPHPVHLEGGGDEKEPPYAGESESPLALRPWTSEWALQWGQAKSLRYTKITLSATSDHPGFLHLWILFKGDTKSVCVSVCPCWVHLNPETVPCTSSPWDPPLWLAQWKEPCRRSFVCLACLLEVLQSPCKTEARKSWAVPVVRQFKNEADVEHFESRNFQTRSQKKQAMVKRELRFESYVIHMQKKKKRQQPQES